MFHAKAAKTAKVSKMDENDLSKLILDAAYKVHSSLGPGLLESVYEIVLAHELEKQGRSVERQVDIPIQYEDVKFEIGFRADLIVDKKVLVELKSVESLKPIFAKQVLSYLRLANLRLGLLINFNEERLKFGLKRIVNGMPEAMAEESLRP